jgi:hypothetical protein
MPFGLSVKLPKISWQIFRTEGGSSCQVDFPPEINSALFKGTGICINLQLCVGCCRIHIIHLYRIHKTLRPSIIVPIASHSSESAMKRLVISIP